MCMVCSARQCRLFKTLKSREQTWMNVQFSSIFHHVNCSFRNALSQFSFDHVFFSSHVLGPLNFSGQTSVVYSPGFSPFRKGWEVTSITTAALSSQICILDSFQVLPSISAFFRVMWLGPASPTVIWDEHAWYSVYGWVLYKIFWVVINLYLGVTCFCMGVVILWGPNPSCLSLPNMFSFSWTWLRLVMFKLFFSLNLIV